ncbi:unnamed protein product [Linum trigynum]|uniref:Protein kinase domain-containing protein n=1 Tax=Linum trigynum TaxID=586398 RepID=A0AAV2GFK4_9ROSI
MFQISGDVFQTVGLISRRHNRRTVHKVAHCPTGALFALKSIPLDADGGRRFSAVQPRRESVLLLDLDHANVVRCHGVAEDRHGGELKLLLEYMDGGSLAGKKISDVGRLASIAGQVLEGIAYLHGRWAPHWDVKPSNILLAGHVAKIADFGASRYLNTIRDKSEFVDAVSYMSPERIEGELNVVVRDLYGFASDIWGFGMSLLEAYLGEYPIGGGGRADCSTLMAMICGAEPPEAPATAPAEFRDFISCCLRREPMARWSAAELLSHPFILHGKRI